MSVVITSRPEKEINGNPLNISKWNAVHNPIKFGMKREDYQVTINVIGAIPDNDIFITITSGLVGNVSDVLSIGDTIFLEVAGGSGNMVITNVTNPSTISGTDELIGLGTGGDSGYMNDLTRKSLIIETSIYAQPTGVGPDEFIASVIHKPNDSGFIDVDVSMFLKSLVGYENDYDYSLINDKDISLGGKFNIGTRLIWLGDTSEPIVLDGVDYYYTNSAKQIGDLYGSNMGEYVLFEQFTIGEKAKFMTDFLIPTIFKNFPRSITFIQGLELTGINTTASIKYVDINIVGVGVSSLTIDVSKKPFVNRLSIDTLTPLGSFADYRIIDNAIEVTEVLRLNVLDSCLDHPIYLCWLNSIGGYDYWLFDRINTEKTSTRIDNMYTKNIIDLETSKGNIDITGKSNKRQVDFGAYVKEESMDGLVSLFESPKVMLLKNPNEWETDGANWQRIIIKPGSLIVSESKKAFFNIKMSMLLPTINTQKE